MTAQVASLRLAQAHGITDTSVLRIGRTDYHVSSLYVTKSGYRVLQLLGEQAPRVFCPDDIVTLVVPTTPLETVPDGSLDVSGEVAGSA